jgi:DNA replication protein DnaC
MSLSNVQFNLIIRDYEQVQLKNQYLMKERLETILKLEPQLQTINESITQDSIQRAKRLIAGDKSALTGHFESLALLTKQREALLVKHGFPTNYLDPIYCCQDCKDTGFINGKKCHCFKQTEYDLVFSQSHLIEDLDQFRFQDFSLNFYSTTTIDQATNANARELATRAFEHSKKFADEFKYATGDNLFLYGTVGVGKTFLSNCIANQVLNAGHSVIYVTAFTLFDIFQKYVFEKIPNSREEYQNIFNCDLLIIDDLGTELGNSFTTSQFFMCINERLLRKKSTIISTNLSLNQLLDQYSERTFSRISNNYQLLKLIGADIRLLKNLQ